MFSSGFVLAAAAAVTVSSGDSSSLTMGVVSSRLRVRVCGRVCVSVCVCFTDLV